MGKQQTERDPQKPINTRAPQLEYQTTIQTTGVCTSKIIAAGILPDDASALNNDLRLARFDEIEIFAYVALVDDDFAAVECFCFEGVGDFGFFPGIEAGEEGDCA